MLTASNSIVSKKIETNKELYFENVISFRKKMKASEIQQEVMKLTKFLERNNLKKKSPLITATYDVEVVNGEQIIDMEYIVAIDREIDTPKEYTFKKIFHLVHAVYKRHVGKLEELQKTYDEILSFIIENHLQQITVGYNVNVNDDKVQFGEEPIIDVYIGVSPNIL